MNLLTVAIGGALGSVARYLITLTATIVPGGSSACGTTIANVVGCAAIGALGEFCLHSEALPWRLVLAIRVGFLGGLTTFSTFAAESVAFASAGRAAAATTYLFANLVIGIVVLVLAAWCVRASLS